MAKKISASVGKGGKNKPVDTTGQATLDVSLDEAGGYPAPSAVLKIDAPATTAEQRVVFAYPIGDELAYDPAELGPATSLDFSIDVLAESIAGASQIDVTLAVLQRELFIASPTSSTPSVDGDEVGWTRLSQTGLQARDFLAADGSDAAPDFSEPFQFAYAFHADYSTGALTAELRVDNMEAAVNTVVLEPTSLGLAAAMGAAVLWRRCFSGEDR